MAVKHNYKSILLFFLLIAFQFSQAQILDPCKWSFKIEQTKPDEATLILTAKLDEGWHLYSQYLTGDGPVPTHFNFISSPQYKLIGKTEEGKSLHEYDKNFDMELKYFEHEAVFKQKISVLSKSDFTVTGAIDFQVCKEECIFPPAKEFSIKVKGNPQGKDMGAATPEVKKDTVAAVVSHADTAKQITSNDTGAKKSVKEMIDTLEPGCGEKRSDETDKSFLGIFIAGMLGGFLALLTPCVFPMIPLTVSFFTKRSKTRKKGIFNAIIYAVSIIVIYVLLGLLITISFGPDALNEMATNVYFNLLFFVIFFLFALSFFGAFEITLPSSWINKADSASERGGLAGIFFMAFTLSLVSFSCTGPIIGTLLVEAAQGRSYIGPLAGMAGFSFALALPFALFAAFPAWLHSLPKSGGWLNSVKVVLGFVELALALKFLSTVDQAYHWNILQREIFIALWIIIFGLMGLYLLGKIKFSHDSDLAHLSVPRLLFAIVTLSFTLYLIPGLWGAPLKLISGFPPPLFYKEWTAKGEVHNCPHDLNCFHDYDEGMAYAKKQGKPVMIDFTGWGCQNCRKMEENVWIEPEVYKRLSEKYVLISLYVDDKTALPQDQQISPYSGKKIKTIGNKWSDFQTEIYERNSQPTYVLLDNRANLLAEPRGYTPDVNTYSKFLEEGLCRYDQRKLSEVAAK
jgi:thiol:disulfide interchange protein